MAIAGHRGHDGDWNGGRRRYRRRKRTTRIGESRGGGGGCAGVAAGEKRQSPTRRGCGQLAGWGFGRSPRKSGRYAPLTRSCVCFFTGGRRLWAPLVCPLNGDDERHRAAAGAALLNMSSRKCRPERREATQCAHARTRRPRSHCQRNRFSTQQVFTVTTASLFLFNHCTRLR